MEVLAYMYLKRASISGFKSFADKVDFSFTDGITCIVGPNGCGKSNVVDAIKWVLGEQSARSLRGRQMVDMIFNGSTTRRSSSLAMVELVFDNSDRALALDQDEVSVSRKLYRSGESEYLLNGAVARLKDVRELFMDTGIGAENYAVIEQGRVDSLLQSSPAERRAIFEEAAGVSRCKARKREAERKLERTEQNLLRVADVVEELEKRLRSVKLQAGKARNFQEYQGRLNSLRATYSLAEYHRFSETLRELQSNVDRHGDAATGYRSEIDRQEAQAAELQAELDRLAERITEADHDLTQARSERAAQEERLQAAQQRADEQEALRERSRQRLATDEERLGQSREHLASLRQQEETLAAEAGEVRSELTASEERDREIARDVKQAQSMLEDEKSGIIDLLRESAQTHNEIVRLKAHRESLVGQQGRLHQRDSEVAVELEECFGQRAALERRLREVEALLAREEATFAEKKQEAATLTTRRGEVAEALAEAKEQRSALQSRRQVLEDLERRMEGVGAGARQLLEARTLAGAHPVLEEIRGLLGDLFETDIAHAPIIEAALGDADQALVVQSSRNLLAATELLDDLPGRLTILGLDRVRSKTSAADGSDDLATFEVMDELPEACASDDLCVADASDDPPVEIVISNELSVEAVGEQVLLAEVDFEATPPGESTVPEDAPAEAAWRDDSSTEADSADDAPAESEFADESPEESESAIASPVEMDFSDDPGFVARAVELVRHPEDLAELAQFLLARTVVVQTLEDALRLADQDDGLHRFVTLRGEVVEPTGRVAVGPPRTQASLISRKSELRDIEVQLEVLTEDVRNYESQLNEIAAELTHLEQLQQELRTAIYESSTAKVEAQAALENIAKTIGRLTQEQPLLAQEMALLDQQITEVARKSEEGGKSLEAMEMESARREERVAAHQGRVDQAIEQRREIQEQVTALRVRAGQIAEKQSAVRDSAGQLERGMRALEESLTVARQDIEQCEQRITEAKRQAEIAEAAGQALESTVVELQDAVNALRLERDERRQTVESIGGRLRQVRAQLTEAEAAQHQTEMKLRETTVRRDELLTRVREELDLDLAEEYASFDEAAVQDWHEVEEEIAELRQKIARLGNVNLDAIKELEELQERHTFLTQQRDDLFVSQRQLKQLVTRLEQEAAERFQKTFIEIRDHFRLLFRKLFGGGKADVLLEDPEDLLDSGIEIVAQPPGKELRGISLMSGGEKSLTAIALVMSMFRSRPAPFAILDEVDAALDEANNERFNRIVQEFVAEAQFILITHSRRTMSIADQLYGVTMQEPGVSTRVSVEFAGSHVA
jgi:chromosome segregation protein